MKKWMKAGFVAVATLLAACGANTTKTQETTVSVSEAQANWDKIVESGVIKVSTAGTLYPQSFHNDKNELTGYDVEIMKEVAKRLNLKVEFTEMGVDGLKKVRKTSTHTYTLHLINTHLHQWLFVEATIQEFILGKM